MWFLYGLLDSSFSALSHTICYAPNHLLNLHPPPQMVPWIVLLPACWLASWTLPLCCLIPFHAPFFGEILVSLGHLFMTWKFSWPFYQNQNLSLGNANETTAFCNSMLSHSNILVPHLPSKVSAGGFSHHLWVEPSGTYRRQSHSPHLYPTKLCTSVWNLIIFALFCN